MNIKEFSEKKGITKQAVYKAINRSGLSAKQLTDRKGNLTKKGVSLLAKLFPDDPELTGKAFADAELSDDQQPEQTGSNEADQLRQRIKELEEKCRDWEIRYFSLIDSQKEETSQLRELIAREQQLRLAAEHKGLFKRLFSGKKQDDQQ